MLTCCKGGKAGKSTLEIENTSEILFRVIVFCDLIFIILILLY